MIKGVNKFKLVGVYNFRKNLFLTSFDNILNLKEVSVEEQDRDFSKPKKIIVATNIAEKSITPPEVGLVVDCDFHFSKQYETDGYYICKKKLITINRYKNSFKIKIYVQK